MIERVSYWLIPAEPDRSHCAQIIRHLAHRFDAPEFEPHVTLYSGPPPSENVETILEDATKGSSQITLQAIGRAHGPDFTRTLFVEFAADERLDNLSKELKRLSTPSPPYKLKPHLSLVYAPLDAGTREQLVRELSVPPTMRFDAVKAIATGSVTQTRADVETWRELAKMTLPRGDRPRRPQV